MHEIIAVDDKLGNLRQALEEQGYQVTSLGQGLGNASVVVVSGMDDNFLGNQSIVTEAQVIDATGLSASEIINEVGRVLQLK